MLWMVDEGVGDFGFGGGGEEIQLQNKINGF